MKLPNGTTSLKASTFVLGRLEHPNRMPFTGIFTWFDAASDYAPNGSGGRKVFIPKEIGIPALPSLVGMAVNYVDETMDGHDPQRKIGVITNAWVGDPDIDGAVPVYVEGYIYAHDFPDAATSIKLYQTSLGFSYETAQTVLESTIINGEEVAVTKEIGYFTGASILYKQSAAYTNTALAASSDQNEQEGDSNVEIQAVLDAIEALKAYVDAKFDAIKAADTVEDAAQESAEGESVEAAQGDQVEEEQKEDGTDMEASSDGSEETEDVTDVQASSDDQAAKDESTAELEAARDEVTSLKVQLASLQAQVEQLTASRKSIAYPQSLMAKYDVKQEDTAESLMASIDARDDLTIEERLALKMEARQKSAK